MSGNVMAEDPHPATASMRPRGDGGGGGELLEDPGRLVGGEHGHGRAELDAPGGGRGGVDHGGRGGQWHRPGVVLAEAEEVQADLVGEVDGLEGLADGLGSGSLAAVGGAGGCCRR